MTIVKSDSCDIPAVTDTIHKYVPEAKLENDVAAELSFILPSDRSSKFENLFVEMDKRERELGIQSYGISVTTMEEVFLRYESPLSNSSGLFMFQSIVIVKAIMCCTYVCVH